MSVAFMILCCILVLGSEKLLVTVAVCCSSKYMKILSLVEEDHNTFSEAKWQERCLSFWVAKEFSKILTKKLKIPIVSYFLFASLLSDHKFMTLFLHRCKEKKRVREMKSHVV